MKSESQGFPGGPVVKNPPAYAGNTGSIPGPGRSHMQWSNKSFETQLLKPAPPRKSNPCSLQLQKALRQEQKPRAAKNNKQIIF